MTSTTESNTRQTSKNGILSRLSRMWVTLDIYENSIGKIVFINIISTPNQWLEILYCHTYNVHKRDFSIRVRKMDQQLADWFEAHGL